MLTQPTIVTNNNRLRATIGQLEYQKRDLKDTTNTVKERSLWFRVAPFSVRRASPVSRDNVRET